MPLPAGARLGPYQIESALDAGGLGEVYRAKDTRLDRTVAVKFLLAHLSADPQFREQFERETRTISQQTHPHICTLHDIGEHDRTAFLVMEHLEGQTLAERLEKGLLPIDDALHHGLEIASALEAAYRHGIVHRDLKPGNLMLTKSGAKLLDFGLAKALDHLVRTCLAKDRDDRWQTAADLHRELKWVAGSLTASSPALAATADRVALWRRPVPLGITVASVLVTLGAAIAAWTWPRPPAASPRVQISTEGGFSPLWSPTGRELFYADVDRR